MRDHGDRLTWILGCRGCHGQDLRGQLWDEDPKEYGIMWASNLTQAAHAMSEDQLRAVITKGVHPRRKELWVMPSEMFQHLSAADTNALVAYLRTLQPAGELSPDPKPGPRALAEIKSGAIKPAAVRVKELKDVQPLDAGSDHALGRYIATVACTECHGQRLEGQKSEEGSTPDLAVAAAYSPGEFTALTTRGEAPGGRKIASLMQSVGKNRLSRLTDHERAALYAYLKARAERPQ